MGNRNYLTHDTSIRVNTDLTLPVQRKFISPDISVSDAAALCMGAEAMAKMAGLMKRLCVSDPDPNYTAVYVIHPKGYDDICKIGVSFNPLARLGQLQNSHWADLRIAFLAWTRDGSAQKIEKLALRAAKEMDWSLRGEWVNASPEEAGELIIKAARYSSSKIADSSAEMENMKAAVGDLFKRRRASREAVMPVPA